MQNRTKANLLAGISVLLGVLMLASGVLAVFLIKEGGWPEPGTSSLGHVGMVVAGIIAAFVSLISGLFTIYCLSKRKRFAQNGMDGPTKS